MRLIKHVFIIAICSISTYGQQNEKHNMTNQEIITTFLNGFGSHEHIEESLTLLADDYKFINPIVELHSKKEFIALAKQIGSVITGIDIINMAENGSWIAVFYNFKTNIKGLESNTGTEWFRIENGLIKESNLIYDTSEWRKFYARLNE